MLIEQGACTVAPGMLDEYPIKSEPQIINTTIDDATSAYITEGILYVNTDDNYAYQVYDTQGKLFLSGESDKAKVSLRGLPKGIYIALIHIKKKTETFKFIL